MPNIDAAITANIAILAELLESAAACAKEAREAAERGECNLAIGTLDIGHEAFDSIGPVFAAIRALHRHR